MVDGSGTGVGFHIIISHNLNVFAFTSKSNQLKS